MISTNLCAIGIIEDKVLIYFALISVIACDTDLRKRVIASPVIKQLCEDFRRWHAQHAELPARIRR